MRQVDTTDDGNEADVAVPDSFRRAGVDLFDTEGRLSVAFGKYEPSTEWFGGHMFYPSTKAAPGDSFFAAQADANNRRRNTLLSNLNTKYCKREENLCVIHSMLFPSVTPDGLVSLGSFTAMVAGLMPPDTTDHSFCKLWFLHVGVPANECLPYDDIMGAIHELFNGVHKENTAAACFALCDRTHQGYILKPVMKQLRLTEPTSFPLSDEGKSTGVPSKDKLTRHLTYLVAKAVLRVFDQVAFAEEEKVKEAFMKGKKKKKLPPGGIPMPSKRQFHIDASEFRKFLATDPYLVAAFLPFAMQMACEVLE